MVGERLKKTDLLVREGTDLVTTNLDVADRNVFSEQRNAEGGSMAALPRESATFRKFVYLGLKIADVEQSPFDHGATAQRSAVKRDVTSRDRAVMGDETQDITIDAYDHDIDGFT